MSHELINNSAALLLIVLVASCNCSSVKTDGRMSERRTNERGRTALYSTVFSIQCTACE